MKLSEQFEKDEIGKLLIETPSVKIKREDKASLLEIISGKTNKFVSELYNIDILNIGENIISITFPEQHHELAEYIIESCDDIGYNTLLDVTNKNINIRIIKNEI